MSLHLVFRADSARHIGSGHVMRCLSLADVATKKGWRCTFLTRAHTGHISSLIEARGHAVSLLPPPEIRLETWLGVTLETEHTQARGALHRLAPDWVVLDHYGLSADWAQDVLPKGTRLFVIDDLADRPQQGDLLLNQTPKIKCDAYVGLVAPQTLLLLGAGFSLLHPDFRALRAKMDPPRRTQGVGSVLLALGGMDAQNVTGTVIKMLVPLVATIGMTRLDVALGATAPYIEPVKEALRSLGVPSTLHVGTREMAALMARADIAIGAGGTMAWERCCLGLPSLALCLADNQRPGLAALNAAGAALVLDGDWEPDFASHMHRLADPQLRTKIGAQAAQMIDGLGCARVISALQACDLNTRLAQDTDTLLIHQWRLNGSDPRFTITGHLPSEADHIAWFSDALIAPNRALLIIEDGEGPVGHIRLDLADAAARVSIILSPDRRGSGIGAAVLGAGVLWGVAHGVMCFTAEIHPDNLASQRIFEQLGFVRHGVQAGFDLYQAHTGGFGVPTLMMR